MVQMEGSRKTVWRTLGTFFSPQNDCFSQNFTEEVKCSQLKEIMGKLFLTNINKQANKSPKIEIQNLQTLRGMEKPGPFFWPKVNLGTFLTPPVSLPLRCSFSLSAGLVLTVDEASHWWPSLRKARAPF